MPRKKTEDEVENTVAEEVPTEEAVETVSDFSEAPEIIEEVELPTITQVGAIQGRNLHLTAGRQPNVSNKRNINFDFESKLIKVKGGQLYLPARFIEEWFVRDNPTRDIDTALWIVDGLPIIKATVTDSDGNVATGICECINFDKDQELRKAESKAVARAIRRLGYGTQYATDPDEQEEYEGEVEIEKTKPAPDLISEAQLDYLEKKVKQLFPEGLKSEDFLKVLEEDFGYTRVNKIKKKDVDKIVAAIDEALNDPEDEEAEPYKE